MIPKSVFDRIVSFLGLVVLSPFLLLIALIIKLERPSCSVLFRQERIGKGGKPFSLLKFRTMCGGSEDGGTVTVRGDERVTPVGDFLRRFKLDELPELLNVLKGEMSFVGPRPDVPGYADKLVGEDREILKLLPGITGPATLKYRDEENLLRQVPDPQKYNDEVLWPDKVKLNREYMHMATFWTDMKIIYATILHRHIKIGDMTL